MKANYVMFFVLGTFLIIVGSVYGWIGYNYDTGIEWAGFPALLALAAMSYMVAVFLWMNERRHGRGASDTDDAEVSEEAGLQGTFAPYSWAPLWCALGAALAFAGVPIGWWLVALGVCVTMVGVVTWALEFSIGHHSH